MNPGEAFIQESRRYLMEEYFPKICRSLEELTDEDLWWRPNDASNSIGNLVLHLAGNARQWVVSGIGGEPDQRKRQEEFDRRDGTGSSELIRHLEGTLKDVDRVLARVSEGDLLRGREIQGLSVTVLAALYHVVEHFSMHTGQIIYLSKLRTGRDLGFYRASDGHVETRW